MLNSRFVCVFIITLCFLQLPTLEAQPTTFLPSDSVTYLWPTNASQHLSSTFAETRSAHLHSGIDIKTWGGEGYRVFATRDGVIHRIGMSPYGYGNVIYMKHSDDSYSVYAHLNRFEPILQEFADSLRMLNYSADLNRNIEEKSFYYKQGDVIGYSGSTGIGPPHLHFELRTPDFKPFNPLLTNLRITDTLPPVFRQLGIEFFDPDKLHQTGYQIFDAARSEDGFEFGEVEIEGPVGLSVHVNDKADQTTNSYAVHSLKLVHESDTLFHSVADHFSYLNTHHMFLDRSYPILAQTRRAFQRLFRVTGNDLPIYLKNINNGVINFDKGVYPLEIFASDIYGNESIARVTLIVNESRKLNQITYLPAYPRIPKVDKPEYSIFLSDLNIITDGPQLGPRNEAEIRFNRISRLFPFTSGQSVHRVLSPDQNNILTTPDKNIWIQFPKNALYDTLEVRLSVEKLGDEIHFSFEPDRLPLNKPIYFNFILPDELRDKEHLVLYSNDKYRNRLFFLGSSKSGRYLRTTMNEISSLVLKEDNLPPLIGRTRLDRNLAGNHLVVVTVRDEHSGIDYQKSTIIVNGERGITEYDPEKNILIYYHPKFTPQANNEVHITVIDGAGNKVTRELTLSF
ncbi:MAG: M23 family metallopeptidase [Balneolaceae bacterium]